jgi:hypothetical protein
LQIQSRVVAPDEVTFLGFTFRVRKDGEIAPESIQLFKATPPSCRIGSPIALPVTASHTRAVLSAEALTTVGRRGCADTTPAVAPYRLGDDNWANLFESAARL